MMHQLLRTGRVESLALEDVAQMTSARSASDLGALHPIRPIYVTTDSTGNGWVCAKGIPGISQYSCGAMHSLGLPSKNAGHPQPLLNFVVLLYSGVPQPAHS